MICGSICVELVLRKPHLAEGEERTHASCFFTTLNIEQ